MDILLHAGFHKSGTTSIQQALLESRDAKFIYPRSLRNGPGHSDIAWAGQDRNSPNFDPDVLIKVVNHFSKKVDLRSKTTFVFSSENFTATSNFEAIHRLACEYDVHLVLTRRPVPEALPSLQQEKIKHGSTNSFLSPEGLVEAEKHIQFDRHRIDDFLISANFKKKTIITTSSARPNFIFENFNRIIGTNMATKIANVGLTTSVLQELVKLNIEYPKHTKNMRINSAIKLAKKSQENSSQDIFKPKWDTMEIELVDYFNSLSSKGIIDYISAQ